MLYVLYGLAATDKYKSWEIRKKRGDGFRTIDSPRQPIISWQRELALAMESIYSPRYPAKAYVKGRGVIDNALPHVARRFVINFDLKDFFPSIHFGRVRGLLLHSPFRMGDEAAQMVAHLCTHNGVLPVGAPTSPIISNMIASSLDRDLIRLAKATGCWYTRYADDITFSTRRQIVPNQIVLEDADGFRISDELLALISSSGFQVNHSKTRVQSRHDSQRVTGLVVNRKLNVPRKFVREVRAMLHAWNRFGLKNAQSVFEQKYDKDRHSGHADFREVLGGKIEYIGHVRGKDDRLYRRLASRYDNLARGDGMYEGEDPVSVNMSGPAQLRILHLSDFHFKDSDTWDSSILLERLVGYLSAEANIDVVVVTGDVAYSGLPTEYDIAEEWFKSRLLDAIGVPEDRLLFVAGNHDVDRSAVSPLLRRFREQSSREADADIQEMVNSASARGAFFAPLDAYLEFTSRFTNNYGSSEFPYYRTDFTVGGYSIAFAGLCSALLSQDDSDQGRLRLASGIVTQVCRGDADLRISAMHHPFRYLSDDDDRVAGLEVRRWSDLVLTGHLHTAEQTSLVTPKDSTTVVSAGSAYQGSGSRNSVQVIDVVLPEKAKHLRELRWDEQQRDWEWRPPIQVGPVQGRLDSL
jgi:RNA-directed DNA polymerase